MLEVQHLTKVYADGTVALKDVSFTIKSRGSSSSSSA